MGIPFFSAVVTNANPVLIINTINIILYKVDCPITNKQIFLLLN